MQTKNGAIWNKKIVSFFLCFVPLHWIWNGNRLNSVYAWMHAYWKWWMLWCLKYISSSVLFTFTLCTTLPQIVCIRFISLLHPLSVSLETHSSNEILTSEKLIFFETFYLMHVHISIFTFNVQHCMSVAIDFERVQSLDCAVMQQFS